MSNNGRGDGPGGMPPGMPPGMDDLMAGLMARLGAGGVPPEREYPKTMEESIDDTMKFKPETLDVIKAFRDAGPWVGTPEERFDKFGECLDKLVALYNMEPIELVFQPNSQAKNGCWNAESRTIALQKKLSVVTFLHEFAHAMGRDERGACRWSLNLFKRIFPEEYAKSKGEGHMLRTDDNDAACQAPAGAPDGHETGPVGP